VLLETVRLAGQLRLPPVVPALGSLLDRGSAEVRRAVVSALSATGTPGSLQQLEKAILDEDRDVRIAAVRAIGAERHAGAHDALEAVVTGRRLRDADLTEKTAFFEAYGSVAGSGDLARLRALLEPHGLFKKKEDPQTRACAAMAIGRINTDDARAVLERYTSDKDPVVRAAVTQALRGGAPA
jgi:HEAT repeat protein